MKNDNAASWRVTQLSSQLNRALVTGLWILRSASPDYQPAYEQLGIAGMLDMDTAEMPARTPWHCVVGAPEGQRVSAAAHALRSVMPQSSLSGELEALPPLSRSGEQALAELTGILSGLSPETASLSRLYPYAQADGSLLSRFDDFALPPGILRLILSGMELEPGSCLYDPCYSSGSLLSQAIKRIPQIKALSLCAQALEPAAYQLGHVYAYLHDIQLELGGKAADTLSEDLYAGRRFDCVLANPPFNQASWQGDAKSGYDPRWQFGPPPRSNGNFAWLQHVVHHLADRGRAAVILPNGTLTTQVQAERDIRAGLLRAGFVEAIIALPAGIFSATRVPCCIWFLAGPGLAVPTTLFIDAQRLKLTQAGSEDLLKLTGLLHQHRRGLLSEKTSWYAAAPLDEIEKKRFVLSPNFYTASAPLSPEPLRRNLPKLTALIDSLKLPLQGTGLYPILEQWKLLSPAKRWESAAIAQLYRISGGIVKNKAAFGHGVPMVDVASVIRGPFVPDALRSCVEVTPAELEKYRVRAGDIFLNRSSENTGELACCCVAAEDRDAVFGGYLKRLRPLSGEYPDPLYMAAYFRSAVYRQEITRVSPVFTTRSNINMARLSEVLVYYPDTAMAETLGQTMLAVFRFQESCFDQSLNARLEQFTQLLIEQFITYPVLLTLEGGSK